MKQLWTVLLVLCLVCFAAACGTGDDDDASDPEGDDDDSADDDDSTGDDDDQEPPDPVDCEEGLVYDGPAPRVIRGPFLQQVDTESVVVRWDTDIPGNTVVRYGLISTDEMSYCDLHEETYHEARIYGLNPNNLYEYVVRSNGTQSPAYSFASAAGAGDPFSFAVYGDNRTLPDNHKRVADATLDADPDFVINVGDIVTKGTVFEQYDTEFFEPAAALLAHKPLYVSIGNHEAEAGIYYRLLALPDKEAWYAFTYGNTRFVSINTNRLYLPGSEQYEWLLAELQSARENGAEWIVCFAHHPAWSEGWDSPGYDGEPLVRAFLVPLFELYNVDVYFAGHTHDYERGIKNGVVHIISGGGGAALDSFQQDFDFITVYESAYHYVYIDVAGPTMTIEAKGTDGTVFDRLVLEH